MTKEIKEGKRKMREAKNWTLRAWSIEDKVGFWKQSHSGLRKNDFEHLKAKTQNINLFLLTKPMVQYNTYFEE